MTGPAFRYNPFTNNLDYAEQGTAPTAGDVFGPASSVNNNLVVFDGVTGKIIKDTGISSIAPTFAGNVTSLTRMIVPYDDNIGGTQGMYFSDGSNAFRQVGTARANYFFGNAGNSTLSGIANTGVGQAALASLTSGIQNTAMGNASLLSLTSGSFNTAYGYFTGDLLTTGVNNTAIGYGALGNCVTGNNNNAFGFLSLQLCTGSSNIAIGNNCLQALLGGTFNVAIGETSGNAYGSSETGNILISNIGVVGDNGTIRIGNNTFSRCFVAGIAGVNVPTPQAVSVNPSTGQLGSVVGSPQVTIKSSDIDLKTVGDTLIFTPTADFIVTGITAYAKNLSGTIGSPTVNIGTNATDYDNIISGLSLSSTQGNSLYYPNNGDTVTVPASTALIVRVATDDATATDNTQVFYITGFYA